MSTDTGHLPGCSFGRTARCNCIYLKQWQEDSQRQDEIERDTISFHRSPELQKLWEENDARLPISIPRDDSLYVTLPEVADGHTIAFQPSGHTGTDWAPEDEDGSRLEQMRIMRDYWRAEAKELKYALWIVGAIAIAAAAIGTGYAAGWW